MTGDAPPHPVVITMMENIGFDVSHLCGLTEMHGPGIMYSWKPERDSLPIEHVKLRSRQGVITLGVEMKDQITMENVECDGISIGEIMLRGNTVMSGYLKDLKATKEVSG